MFCGFVLFPEREFVSFYPPSAAAAVVVLETEVEAFPFFLFASFLKCSVALGREL